MKNKILSDLMLCERESFECEIRGLVYAGFLTDSEILREIGDLRKSNVSIWDLKDSVDALREIYGKVTPELVEEVKQVLQDNDVDMLNTQLDSHNEATLNKVSKEHSSHQLTWPEATSYDRLSSAFQELEGNGILTPKDAGSNGDHYEADIKFRESKGVSVKGCVWYSKLSFEQWCNSPSDAKSKMSVGLNCRPVIDGEIISYARNKNKLDEAKKLHLYVISVLNSHGINTDADEFNDISFKEQNVVIYLMMEWQKRRG